MFPFLRNWKWKKKKKKNGQTGIRTQDLDNKCPSSQQLHQSVFIVEYFEIVDNSSTFNFHFPFCILHFPFSIFTYGVVVESLGIYCRGLGIDSQFCKSKMEIKKEKSSQYCQLFHLTPRSVISTEIHSIPSDLGS